MLLQRSLDVVEHALRAVGLSFFGLKPMDHQYPWLWVWRCAHLGRGQREALGCHISVNQVMALEIDVRIQQVWSHFWAFTPFLVRTFASIPGRFGFLNLTIRAILSYGADAGGFIVPIFSAST